MTIGAGPASAADRARCCRLERARLEPPTGCRRRREPITRTNSRLVQADPDGVAERQRPGLAAQRPRISRWSGGCTPCREETVRPEGHQLVRLADPPRRSARPPSSRTRSGSGRTTVATAIRSLLRNMDLITPLTSTDTDAGTIPARHPIGQDPDRGPDRLLGRRTRDGRPRDVRGHHGPGRDRRHQTGSDQAVVAIDRGRGPAST